jgi:hypothetical protein
MIPIVILVALAGMGCVEVLDIQKTDRVGRKIENRYLIADLSSRMLDGAKEDGGALRGLTYKPLGVTLLRTQHAVRMHWAPNLRRPDAPLFKGLGAWEPVQEFREEQKDGVYIHHREGHLQDFPEVKMETEYRFYPGVPYFLFWSRMTVEKQLQVVAVRNNEMTMDHFFTHVAWPDRNGKLRVATFDESAAILAKEPVAADAPWMAFLNLEKGYGYGYVTLDYKTTKSVDSRMNVSSATNNGGKLWSRIVITGKQTQLDPGDRFEERSAYVLFHSSRDEPVQEFLAWRKKIQRKFRYTRTR